MYVYEEGDVEMDMREWEASKKVLLLISFAMLILSFCVDIGGVNRSLLILLTITINPHFLDRIEKKITGNECDYKELLIQLSYYLCLPLATFVIVVYHTNVQTTDSATVMKSFKVTLYLLFLCALFIGTISKYDSKRKYIIFGLVYLFCVIQGYAPEELFEILNRLPLETLDWTSYEVLINGMLNPIKEAILTFIIFDTVFDYVKKNGKREENVNNNK